MNIQAFYHQPKSNYCYALSEDTIVIRFRTAKDDVSSVQLIYGDKYKWDQEHHSAQMILERSDQLFDYYTYKVKAEGLNYRLSYVFKIESDKDSLYYSEWGAEAEIDPKELHLHYFNFPYLNEVDVHRIPDWVEDAVFYQIFPERFKNGNKNNDPETVEAWETGIPSRENFFGGDLEGVIEKVDYLSDLGVNAIYMTPVFKSTTNHKYDTTDYFQIDPHFGDNETLKKLVEKCHSKGIKVVLDAVFNHCGYMFDKFQDVVEKGEKSPYYNWFYIKDWPIDFEEISYQTFGFEPKMPKLNTANPEVIDYLLKVATYWIEFADIDGWRLDVANEIDHDFWRQFKKAVKAVKEEAYIVGEIWHNAQPWLLGDQFDGSMNYPFTRACLNYFAWHEGTPTDFANMINTNIVRYTRQANQAMLNLLDSHDTPRFLTEAGGDREMLKMAGLFQMTFEGAPSIYYGTEIGMEGENDPGCRRPMRWDAGSWESDVMDFYKAVIRIRHNHIEMRRGDIQFIDHENVLIYKKQYIGDADDRAQSIILMNREDKEYEVTLEIDAVSVEDLLTGNAIDVQEHKLTIKIAPKTSYVLKVHEK